MVTHTEHSPIRNFVNILSYMEYILSEIDHLYLQVLYFRHKKLFLKSQIDKNILKLYEQLLEKYEQLINTLIKRKFDLQKQITPCNIIIDTSTIKHSNNANNNMVTMRPRIMQKLQQIEEKINTIRNNITFLKRAYDYLSGLNILNQLDLNEYILYMLTLNNQKTIITNNRIFIHNLAKGSVNFFYITDIKEVSVKNTLFFKGCIIKLIDKTKIKITLPPHRSRRLKKILEKVINLKKNLPRYSPKKLFDERPLIRPNIKTLKTEILKTLLDNHTNIKP